MSPRRARAVHGRTGDPGEALRDHLVEVAGRLLSDRDVASITTRELARAAGVSDGVLYNYFADKNELLLAALVRRFAQLVRELETALADPREGSLEASLLVVVRALFDLHAEALPIFAKISGEHGLQHRLMHEIHAAHAPFGGAHIRGAVVRFLESEQARGRLGAVDPGVAADLVIGAAAMLAFTSHLDPSPRPDLLERLPAVVETLVSGLGPQRRSAQ